MFNNVKTTFKASIIWRNKCEDLNLENSKDSNMFLMLSIKGCYMYVDATPKYIMVPVKHFICKNNFPLFRFV